MPRPKRKPMPHDNNDQIAATLAELAEFADRTYWSRSSKGNLTRKWEALSLTIFKHRDGHFNWCIYEEEYGPRYSTSRYEDEVEAMDSLGYELISQFVRTN